MKPDCSKAAKTGKKSSKGPVSVGLKCLILIMLFMAVYTFFCGRVVIRGEPDFKLPGYLTFTAVCVILYFIRFFHLSSERPVSIGLKYLILITLFMTVFIFFCGPVVIRGEPDFKFPRYLTFAAVSMALWFIRLGYLSFKKRSDGQNIDFIGSAANAFDKKPFLAAVVLIFIGTVLRWRDFYSVFKPISTSYLLLNDGFLTAAPVLNILFAKIAIVILVIAVFKFMKRLAGKAPALAAVVLIAVFPFNNNNFGLFYVETLIVAAWLLSLHFLLSERRGIAYAGGVLLTAAFAAHPAGYGLLIPAGIILVSGGKREGFSTKRFCILIGAAVAASCLWYVIFGKPLLNLSGKAAAWQGYDFSVFFSVIKKLFRKKLVVYLFSIGFLLTLGKLVRRGKEKNVNFALLLSVLVPAGLWWAIVHTDFSLNALAVALPLLFLLAACPIAAFNSARFFTRTLFDRNVAAVVTIMIMAYLLTMYDFNKAMLSTMDYSIFEMSRPYRTGKVIPDEDAELGHSLVFDKGHSGILVFGPYRYMLPGKYEVRFRLRVERAEFTDGICAAGTVEVVSNKGLKVIAERPVEFAQEQTHGYHEYVLPFELDQLEEVEFRLAGNQTADIYVDSIHLFRM